MSGIFGIWNRDDTPVPERALRGMAAPMRHRGPEGVTTECDGPVAFGCALRFNTPAARLESLPAKDPASNVLFTAAARVDNRAELAEQLSIRAELPALADGELIRRAYSRWGEACPSKIVGDWSFAAWDPRARRLFLARDHFGNTALYYASTPRVFAFASSRAALLALHPHPAELDELYLAQVLVSWTANHGERTVHQSIRRLPPSWSLTVTQNREEPRQYWRLEDTPEVRLPRRADYVSGFTEVFDRAVSDHLRSSGPVGVTLSGGLDSGAVTATAAAILKSQGRRLSAFTSAPLVAGDSRLPTILADETPFAEATARAAGNVDPEFLTCASVTPLGAIRQGLDILLEPTHSAGNLFWITELIRVAAARGCTALLTGQHGNAGISFAGDVFFQPLACQWKRLGPTGWLRARAKRSVPSVLRIVRKYRTGEGWRGSAIHPAFAKRIDLRNRRLDDPAEYPRNARLDERARIMLPGRSFAGALHDELGVALGLEVRDPTADPRVLAYCFSVPEDVFIDPATGIDRWLIREAMKGRLPDSVRLNRRRGRQAADLGARLRASADEVEAALTEVAGGPGAEYVDVDWMRQVWTLVRTGDSLRSLRLATTVLTRGLMAGLFVNGFGSKW